MRHERGFIMLRRIVIPLLAISGIGLCVFMVYFSTKKPKTPPILFSPPTSPYKHYIAGEGVIESAYKNITIAPAFNQLISDIYVTVGSIVKKDAPLFKLNTQHLEAQLIQAQQDQKTAETNYKNQKVQYSFYTRLKNKSAVSEQAYQATFYAMKVAEQQLESAKAAVNVIKTDIALSTTRAPIDGEVLQVNIRVGQFANSNPFSNTSLILFGDTRVYHVRIDIDEEDSWRLIKGAPATAFLRGNSRIAIPLEFVYLEPYIIPKISLSGSDVERVDTRVLQVVYQLPKDKYPVYAGELLDIYLEAKPNEEGT